MKTFFCSLVKAIAQTNFADWNENLYFLRSPENISRFRHELLCVNQLCPKWKVALFGIQKEGESEKEMKRKCNGSAEEKSVKRVGNN